MPDALLIPLIRRCYAADPPLLCPLIRCCFLLFI
jgi:hypothetical protein